MAIRVQQAAFDPGQELNALHAQNVGIGAVVGFVGYVRDFNDGREVGGMFLEHYPGMTEKALGKIAAEAGQRWPLLRLEILHRIGRLEPGEPIVFVGCASAHRQAAFDACNFVMDYLEDPRAVLEEGRHRRRPALGRRPLQRPGRRAALGGVTSTSSRRRLTSSEE